jgi:hypothetical protein
MARGQQPVSMHGQVLPAQLFTVGLPLLTQLAVHVFWPQFSWPASQELPVPQIWLQVPLTPHSRVSVLHCLLLPRQVSAQS